LTIRLREGARTVVNRGIGVVIARLFVGASSASGVVPVANPTIIWHAYTIIDIVTDAIPIGVSSTFTTTLTQSVELVAIAVAIAIGNADTSAFIDLTWAVANSACINFPNASIDNITNSIRINIFHAISPAITQCIEV
jgi:hypothetical protein